MGTKNHYPLEMKDLSPEDTVEVLEHFGGTHQDGFFRIGPKGYLLPEGFREDAANVYNMPLRPDDTFVITFPKAGTTWTQELVWLVANDLDYETSQSKTLQERFPFLENSMLTNNETTQKLMRETCKGDEKLLKVVEALTTPGSERVAGVPSPRFIKSHLPLSLLPPALLQQARVVYVARDPRDVAVSYYHHYKLFTFMGYTGTFKDYWSTFIKDMVVWAPYFPHVLEAWEQRHHPNMLFMFYEDMLKDLPSAVRRVADFLGKALSEEQVATLCDHLSFHNFKNNKSVNFEGTRDLGVAHKDYKFMRKGKSGDWRDHFDEEMAAQAQRWIDDNLRGTDLRYPSLRKL